jgi:hypothetical protein
VVFTQRREEAKSDPFFEILIICNCEASQIGEDREARKIKSVNLIAQIDAPDFSLLDTEAS